MHYLMGIDLGTSSVKTMIMSLDGSFIRVEYQNYNVSVPKIGMAEQNPDDWFEKTELTIKKLLSNSKIKSDEIKVLSFSGQMHGLVCVDKNGNLLCPAIIWSDQRSLYEIKEIYNLLGKEFILTETQNNISTGFLIASLYWIYKNDTALYKKIYKVMLPKDYIKYRLTGRIATDFSDAGGSLAFNNIKLSWASNLIEKLGIDIDLFPEPLPSSEEIGKIVLNSKNNMGLSPNTKVINGGADTCMQAIGNGIIKDGIFSSNIGTGGQISTSSSKMLFNEKVNVFPHVLPNKWNIMGANLNSGSALKWLCNEILNTNDYKTLDFEAEKLTPGAEGLMFLPYLTGERTPYNNPLARGMFFGLTSKHNKYNMFCSVMEGVTYSLKDCMNILTEDLNIVCDKVIASGGGANSSLWLQMQADILEKEIYRSKVKEQACFGAVITAGVGSGTFKSFTEACELLIKFDERIFEPNKNNVEIYKEYHKIYKKLYFDNKDTFENIAKLTKDS